MFDLLLFGSANLFLGTLKIDFHFLSGTEMGEKTLPLGYSILLKTSAFS
jgi:hypothetical protein